MKGPTTKSLTFECKASLRRSLLQLVSRLFPVIQHRHKGRAFYGFVSDLIS